MRTLITAALTLLLASPALAAETKPPASPHGEAAPAAPAAPPKKANAPKALRDIGLSIGKSLETLSLSKPEQETVIAALREGLADPTKLKQDQETMENINLFARGRMEARAEQDKAKGAAYLAQQAKQKGAVKTEGGAIVIPMKEGTGATPGPTDKVKVHYTGTLINGAKFDDSRERKQPAEFPLNGVVPCWTQALQKMKVGGRAKIVCPSDLAYGAQGRPNIPANSVLNFDVELLEVTKAPPAPLPPPPESPLNPKK
jgi:FKBP-type peptidyl-prolyl cis-trans isomerase